MTTESLHFDLITLGQRLDIMLAAVMPNTSRAQIQEWIKDGRVRDAGNGVPLKASLKLKTPLRVSVDKPILAPFEPPKPEMRSALLDIVYEDDALIVINKPIGLTVHPGAGQHTGTLVNLLLGHTGGQLSDLGTQERPGIVHRLDKDTSGLMVVAKTNRAHAALAESIQNRDMKRVYNALVFNQPNPRDGTVDAAIGRDPRYRQRMALVPHGGKHAITHYTTLRQFGLDFTLVECRLETGRTHQIRVHLASIGCPVMGDTQYAGRHDRRKRPITPEVKQAIAALPGQALHAGKLSFPHPLSGEILSFTVPMPLHLQEMVGLLGR